MRPALLAVALLFPLLLHSQEFEVPKNYSFVTAEDYVKYQPDILRCIDFLEEAPLDENPSKRKEANAFLLKWLVGSPNVNVDLHPYVTDFSQKNKDFLAIFMGGWTRLALQQPDSATKIRCHLAGVRSVIGVYKKGRGVIEDSKVEDLMERQEDGELEDWLNKQISKK